MASLLSILLSDEVLGITVPILIYWLYSYTLSLVENSYPEFKLQSAQEHAKENCLVSKQQVIRGVLLQQAVQASIAALLFFLTSKSDDDKLLMVSTMHASSVSEFRDCAMQILELIIQFLTAMLVMDTWQYFMHRFMHHNTFLYKHVHSQHHKLVAPYAYGALYNHPLEGLLVDTMSGAISFLVSGMSPRASIFFFSFATLKAVDDHSGLRLPWHLFQVLFTNNSVYHSLHHQLHGTKYNFSQPFFVFWDRLLGTYYIPPPQLLHEDHHPAGQANKIE